MKTSTYILRPVTDINDMVMYYEFVRKEDDAILRASADYDFLLAYAEGYTTARNSSFIVESSTRGGRPPHNTIRL